MFILHLLTLHISISVVNDLCATISVCIICIHLYFHLSVKWMLSYFFLLWFVSRSPFTAPCKGGLVLTNPFLYICLEMFFSHSVLKAFFKDGIPWWQVFLFLFFNHIESIILLVHSYVMSLFSLSSFTILCLSFDSLILCCFLWMWILLYISKFEWFSIIFKPSILISLFWVFYSACPFPW